LHELGKCRLAFEQDPRERGTGMARRPLARKGAVPFNEFTGDLGVVIDKRRLWIACPTDH
jgi:hypothetical protein